MKLTLTPAIVAALLMLSFAAPVAAGPFEDARAAYTARDDATALRLMRPLAEQGNADAQLLLGVIFAEGRGIPQDDTEAVKWWRKAADQGKALAQLVLGTSYDEGKGVPQDYAEA